MERQRKYLACACDKHYCLAHPGKVCKANAVSIRNESPICYACKRNAYFGVFRSHEHTAKQVTKTRAVRIDTRDGPRVKPTIQVRQRG